MKHARSRNDSHPGGAVIFARKGLILIAVVWSAARCAGADSPVHYHRMEGQRRIELPLELDSVAVVFDDSAAPSGDRSISGYSFSTLGVKGWQVATLPAGLRSAGDIEALVAEWAARPDVAFASPVFRAENGSPLLVTPDVFVAIDPASAAIGEAAMLDGLSSARLAERDWRNLSGVHRVHCNSKNGFSVLEWANALATRPGVRYAECDFVFTGTSSATAPDDTLFPDQWGMLNVGQAGGVAGIDINILPAWDFTLGDPATLIVVLDVGVQQNHPDLHLAPGKDFTSDSTPENPLNGGPQNVCDNHATWVAGFATAIAGNALGVAGAAPDCRIASARIGISNTPTCNLNWHGQISWTADGILWAQSIGARVTNNSNAYAITSSLVRDAYDTTRAAGIVHFASAGNDGDTSVTYPASLGSVIAVGAVNRFGERSDFSNHGGSVNFMGPGEDVWTTDRTGPDGKTPGDFATVMGTSFATPYAASAAALVLTHRPALSAIDVEAILENSAFDLGIPGPDSEFSHGLIDAQAALKMASCYASWTDVTSTGPSGRTNHAMAYDAARNRVVLFGGLVGAVASRETWEWDGTSWSLRSTTGPTARYGHTMAYDAVNGDVILHGGFAGAAPSLETWSWDGSNWTLVANTGPSARYLHASVYDAARQRIVMFGGRNTTTANRETWTWDGLSWYQVDVLGPSARNYHAMAYDSARGVTVLFGGTAGADELWEWDGQAWALVSIGGFDRPAGRERSALAYDEAAGTTVLFGGLSGSTDLRDTWEWNGAMWKLRSFAGPSARQRHTMVYDAAAERVFAFGGITGSTRFADSWTWRLPRPVIATQPLAVAVLPGMQASFSVEAAGVSPLSYQWRRNGVPLDDTDRISGAHTAVLTIDPVAVEDASGYTVDVADACMHTVSETAILAIQGDADGDGDIDLTDYAAFADCLFGPQALPAPTETCLENFDAEGDGDVDLADFAAFSRALTVPAE